MESKQEQWMCVIVSFLWETIRILNVEVSMFIRDLGDNNILIDQRSSEVAIIDIIVKLVGIYLLYTRLRTLNKSKFSDCQRLVNPQRK